MTSLTAQPGTFSASLIEALHGPEPERALQQAFVRLANGADLPLVLAMLKALVSAGLAGVASKLLGSASGLLSAEPQLAALAEQLASMPSGEVPKRVLENRFQSNAAALLTTRPSLAPFVDALAESLDEVRVFASRSGNLHVIREGANRQLDLVFPFVDQRAFVRGLGLPELSLTSSYLMVGVPSVALWERLLSLKTDSGFQPPIDIVEPDASILGLWLHLIETSEALADERVNIFCGEHAVHEYKEFLANHSWRRPATHASTNFRPRWTPPVLNSKFHEAVADRISQRQAQAAAQLEQRVANRNARWWAERFCNAFSGGPPLRIAGFTTRYSTVIQHSMRDLAAAFERRGCVFDIIKQPNPYCAHVDVTGSLLRHDYDLIVVIDHLRSEFAGSIPANIPFVCWVQDHMDGLCTPQAGASVTALDVVVGQSPGLMNSAYGYPLERFIASTNLTDPITYSDEKLPDSELEPYRCDVSYIGHGSATPKQLAVEIASQAPPAFQRMLERFVVLARERLEGQTWLTLADRMELALEAERESGHSTLTPTLRRTALMPAIDRLFDRLIRHQTLEWVANWARSRKASFRIFGKGWDSHTTLKEFAGGEIGNGRPLRAAYQACAVSLQVTGYASLHQRLLDGLCSGATMIVRFNPFDFLRRAHGEVAKHIAQSNVSMFADLLDLAVRRPNFARAIAELERLGHARIAPAEDETRVREAELYKQCFDTSDEALSETGLLDIVRTGRFIPHRATCDLPGIDDVVFKNEQSLHQLLDDLVADPDRRQRLMQPMRQSVLANDTHDVLVDRVLDMFANQPRAVSDAT